MNDRLKYRIWNKLTNSYTTGGCLKFGQMCFVSVETYEEEIETNIKPAEDQDNYIIEQCTGLKDKNGNLIYEGDIVKDEFGRKFKVIWSEEDCMFDGRIIYYDPEFGTRFDLYQGATDNSEIIGNIHEQAEQNESSSVNNKIKFPEYNDNLLEEFDKQFFENGQDDDLTETALEQKDK